MIPKIIYMCHKTLDEIKIYSQKWKELNPEYEIKLYDDELCQQFLLTEYSQLHLDIFNFIPDGPIKCDFWRLCIINKYGGLYVDADINPLVPLKQYIEEDDDFVTCISLFYTIGETEWQLNPHLILSHKNNEILEKNIENFIDLYKNNKEKYNYWDWSICKRLYINGVREKKSHVLIENGKKYKFLYEKTLNDCEYNDIIVLHNHYDNYTNNRFY